MPTPFNLLVLTDEPSHLDRMVAELRRADFAPHCQTAANQEDFLRAVDPSLDLILSEYTLAHFDALSALDLLRERQLATPLIVVSAMTDANLVVESMRHGAADYLFADRLDRLGAAVTHALQERRRGLENQRAEQALRRSEERYRLLVDAAPDVIITADADAKITSLNPAFERLTGWKAEEWLGHPYQDLVHPDDLPTANEHFRRLLEGIKPPILQFRTRTKDPHRFVDVEATTAVKMQDGKVIGFLSISRDVSERKRLEAQFFQAQKMEAIGTVTAGVAHDFNNLLTIINGYSELVLMGLQADNPVYQPLQEIKKAGNRAVGLTRQLLAFSRKQVLAPTVLDLNAAITEIQKMLRRLIGEEVTLTTYLDPRLGFIKADQGQIEQVLMNLAVNARDAMPGGGQLIIETHNVDLDDSWALKHPDLKPGDYVLLAITDTGCGMNPAVQARAFEPFFTTKPAGKGTGLGLATAYGIVEQSGGHIHVYSEVGRGTTFKIYLPHMAAAAASKRPSGPLGSTRLNGTETLLLVEDDAEVRSFARIALEAQNYTVVSATHGAEALNIWQHRQAPFDLVVTDLVMPQMGGRELADRLHALNPHLKVLFFSGYTGNVATRQGILESGAPFLQKPFTPHSLARKVREVLDAG